LYKKTFLSVKGIDSKRYSEEDYLTIIVKPVRLCVKFFAKISYYACDGIYESSGNQGVGETSLFKKILLIGTHASF